MNWHPTLPVGRRPRMRDLSIPTFTRKDEADCCLARRDKLGRLPVGFCGPSCLRRAERDEFLRS